MPQQYVSTDKRTGLEVTVTGDFPEHPQDRIRIARTTNLFTRLTSTILAMDSESQRREAFIAVETQMELAEAMIRQDMEEVRRLLQETMQRMGVSPEQMREIQEELKRRLGDMGGMSDLFAPPDERPDDEPPPEEPVL
jgi:DNA/RNA-binding domain of Phe-tRNA-synthetase-like protein